MAYPLNYGPYIQLQLIYPINFWLTSLIFWSFFEIYLFCVWQWFILFFFFSPVWYSIVWLYYPFLSILLLMSICFFPHFYCYKWCCYKHSFTYLLVNLYTFLLGRYIKRDYLGYRLCTCFALVDNDHFSKVSVPIYTPISCVCDSSRTASVLTGDSVSLLSVISLGV